VNLGPTDPDDQDHRRDDEVAGLEKSTLASTSMRTPAEAMIPKSRMQIPP